jgi:hypothetical protein
LFICVVCDSASDSPHLSCGYCSQGHSEVLPQTQQTSVFERLGTLGG